jgi:hypothetical protein
VLYIFDITSFMLYQQCGNVDTARQELSKLVRAKQEQGK